MNLTATIPQDLADAITDVVNELASEIDLHYEDDELVATASTLQKMEHLVGFLVSSGHGCPETYKSVIERYHRSLH